MVTCIIEFQPSGRRIKATTGITILQAAQQAGVAIASNCGAEGNAAAVNSI
jgi:uncharacterized 2Fe-2S/4Fe-4S cluster protein (DUF4445 family)